MVPFGRRRRTAIMTASRTSSRRKLEPVAQPTISLENRSITTARYSQPCQVRMYVISVTQILFGRMTSKFRLTRSGAMTAGLPPE